MPIALSGAWRTRGSKTTGSQVVAVANRDVRIGIRFIRNKLDTGEAVEDFCSAIERFYTSSLPKNPEHYDALDNAAFREEWNRCRQAACYNQYRL